MRLFFILCLFINSAFALNGNSTLNSTSVLSGNLENLNNITNTQLNNIIDENLNSNTGITADDLNIKLKALEQKVIRQCNGTGGGSGTINSCSDLSVDNTIAGNSTGGDNNLSACLHNKQFFSPNCKISSSNTCTSSCEEGEYIIGDSCLAPSVNQVFTWQTNEHYTIGLDNLITKDSGLNAWDNTLLSNETASGNFSITIVIKKISGSNGYIGLHDANDPTDPLYYTMDYSVSKGSSAMAVDDIFIFSRVNGTVSVTKNGSSTSFYSNSNPFTGPLRVSINLYGNTDAVQITEATGFQ